MIKEFIKAWDKNKELLHTDIIMYPAGSVRQEEAKKDRKDLRIHFY